MYELDADGKQLRVRSLTDYTAEKVRALWSDASDLRRRWAVPEHRAEIVEQLADRGVDFAALAEQAGRLTRIRSTCCATCVQRAGALAPERADRVRRACPCVLRSSAQTRAILNDVLDNSRAQGGSFKLPDVLHMRPISKRGPGCRNPRAAVRRG